MMTSRLLLVGAGLAAAVALAPERSEARHGRGPMLPAHVESVASTRWGGDTLRGIAGVEHGRAYLVVEQLRGDWLVAYRRIAELSFGAHNVPMRGQDIQLTGWRGTRLGFVVDGRGNRLRCHVDVAGHNAWQAVCAGRRPGGHPGGGHPGGGPPGGNNWAGDARVIRACGDSFEGQQNESACLDAVAHARFDPTDTITACERAMDGDANELTCVRQAVAGGRPQLAALTACEQAMEGDSNELGCFQVAATSWRDLGPDISACERAMEGDANELACIRVVAAARRPMAEIVDRCEQAMSGDASELACVERAAR